MKKTITFLLFALFTGVLSAQTVSIQGGSSYSTIADAVTAAVDGDVILITGTHTLTASIGIGKSITLRGSNPAIDIIQAAAAPSTAGLGTRVIGIGAPSGSPTTYAALNVTVENLTIRHGSVSGASVNGGGIVVDKITGLVTLNNLIITDNFSANNGGGISIAGSNVNITNCTLKNNTSTLDGGAIVAAPNNASLINSVINIKQSLINANTARNGGGIYINGNNGFGNTYKIDVTIENSTVSNNTSAAGTGLSGSSFGGGAIYSNSQPLLPASTFGNVTLSLVHATLYGNLCTNYVARAGLQFNNAKVTNFGAYNSIIVGNDDLTATGPKAINFTNTNITNIVNCIFGGTTVPPAIVSAPYPNTNNNQTGKTAAHAGITGTLTSEGGNTQVFKLNTPANTAVDFCTVATGVTIPTIDQRGFSRTGAGVNYDAGAFEVVSGCDAGPIPTNVNCYDNYQVVDCAWVNIGTQPPPPLLACYQTLGSFNNTTCQWDVIGTQPAAPTELACYQTTTFNTGTCSWDVTGTEPAQPPLECYQTATFNSGTCSWDVTGTPPVTPEPPTGLVCYETAIYNGCAWVISGTQPAPPTLECYQTLGSFNTVSCVWEVLGTAPATPNAGTDGTLTATSSPSDAALFAALTGADAGGTWTRPESGFTGVYTYTVSQAAPCTASDSSTVTVTTTQIPTTFPAFCKGATVATATGSTTMKFYAAATGGTALAGTIALSNAKTYFVSEVINTVESFPRVSKTITVTNPPATPGVMITTDAVLCKLIGTTNTVTYTLPVPAVAVGSYNWAVTEGINIVADDFPNDNTITVNFLNAATLNTATGGVGTISARAVTSSLTGSCESAPRSLALTSKFPTAPTSLVMTSTDETEHFSTKIPLSDPVAYYTSLSDLTKITKVGPYIGTGTVFILTAAPAPTAASYKWTLPAGVNPIESATVVDLGLGIATSTTPIITVNFAGITPGIVPPSLPIVVQSVGGCGNSSNRTLTLVRALPTAPTKLVLTSADPTPRFSYKNPVTLETSLVGLNTLAKITKVGPYVGTSIPFTLTATPFTTQGGTATSYAWVLPAGVVCTSPYTVGVTPLTGTTVIATVPTLWTITDYITTTSSTITVNFSGVSNGITALPVSIYAVNGTGNSKARTLTLLRTLPTAPTKLVLTDEAITLTATVTTKAVTKVGPYTGKTTALTLTATPFTTQGAEATSYKWTLPDGVNVTAGATEVSDEIVGTKTWTSTSTVLTVNLAGISGSSMTSIPLSVQAVNGAGTSATARTLTATAAVPTAPTITAGTTLFSTCAGTTTTYTATAIQGATYTWGLPNGATGTSTTNSIVVDFTGVTIATSYAITCIATNGTGPSLLKSLTIKKSTAACRTAAESIADDFNVIAYPNPSSSEFTIKSSAKGAMSVKVYDMQGRLVEKANTDKVGSKLATGTYNVIVNQGANTKTVRVIKK